MKTTSTRLSVAAALLLSLIAARTAEASAKKSDAKKSDANFTLVFVGGAQGDADSPTLVQLRARLKELEPDDAAVVFTGNYMKGDLPAEGEKGREDAERALKAHVDATLDFVKRGGNVYFLPGHLDYPNHGTRAVRRLRDYLNDAFKAGLSADDDAPGRKLDVMPVAGCIDPHVFELRENLGLMLLDSQWWTQDLQNDPMANEGCDLKNRGAFGAVFKKLLTSYRGRRLVIASHLPVRSYGPLGGSFTAGAHLSPAPVLGTASVLVRAAGLVPQYANHPLVRAYTDFLYEETQRNGEYVLASGHDDSLQLMHVRQQTQIISGTSSRHATPTVGANEGDFASATPGWAELELDTSGAGQVSFYAGETEAKLVFQSALPAPKPRGTEAPQAIPPMPASPVMATYTTQHVWQLPSGVRFFVGSYYSQAYALKLPYELLDLTTEQGGLRPVGLAGGMQTDVVKFKDPTGAEWVARRLAKVSARVLPWPQNQATIINRMIDHGYTGAQPEAPLVLPRLAEAFDVLHPEPRLLYLPDQEGLGPYRGYLANEVVLFEEKPKEPNQGVLPETLAGPPSEHGKTTFSSLPETVAALHDKPWKNKVDQEAMLRARLLDTYVGDFDRHQGQWTFAITPSEDGTKTYRPVAKDRDQALTNYDGVGLMLGHLIAPTSRPLQAFTGDYPNIEWTSYAARDVDRVFLNEIPHARWIEIARQMQAAVTDDVITEALSTMHSEAYAIDGPHLTQALQLRRDKLIDIAEKYFRLLNQDADVVGSNRDDRFDLWFLDGGRVRVTARKKEKPGKKKEAEERPAYFDRTFEPSETSELRIYALEGDDQLLVHGNAPTSIEVRYVGGPGADTAEDADAHLGSAPLKVSALHFYDSPDGATFDSSIDLTDSRSNRAIFNEYDQFENHDPGFGTFVPAGAINPDDGLFIGGVYQYTAQGWKKHPFAARHTIGATFATATLGAQANYTGLFPQTVWLLDQQLDLIADSPTYSRNFYGLTNTFVPNLSNVPDYYRVRQAQLLARYGLSYGFGGDRSRVGAQIFGQGFDTQDTQGRFIDVESTAMPNDLGARFFGGARLYAETNTFDDLQLPKRGVALHASLEGRYDLGRGTELSVTYKAGGALAFPFDRGRRVVLITRANVEGIVGPHPFFFAPTLGGNDLRAYHTQQLAGDIAFAQTTDLRVDVLRFWSVLPGTVGVNVSVDHGRVFGTLTPSNAYHVDFGGGVWWSILDMIGLQLTYFRSLDGATRFVFTAGPLFAATGF